MYHNILFTIIFINLLILPGYSKNKTDMTIKGAVLAHIHNQVSGYGSAKSEDMHNHLLRVGYNSIQINTFCYMKDKEIPFIYYNFDSTMKKKTIKKEINSLHKKGFTVMLKPHLWIGGNEFNPDNWRNSIDYTNPGELATWFHNYGNYIKSEAVIAEMSNVEIFVIGTELVKLTKYEKEWRKLIKEVRAIYSGKITYAAEGNNAFNINFWDALDFIGVDAYFSLTEETNPDLSDLEEGWKKYENKLSRLSERFGKKIIFTEIGYKSVKGTAVRPWEWNNKENELSQLQQAHAFEAMYRTFGNKEYIEGIYIWKYFTDNNSYEKENVEKGFTPYGKIAEGVISEWIK